MFSHMPRTSADCTAPQEYNINANNKDTRQSVSRYYTVLRQDEDSIMKMRLYYYRRGPLSS